MILAISRKDNLLGPLTEWAKSGHKLVMGKMFEIWAMTAVCMVGAFL